MTFGTADWICVLLWLACMTVGCLLAARTLIHWFQLESYQFPGYFRTLKRQGQKALLPGLLTAAGFFLCCAALLFLKEKAGLPFRAAMLLLGLCVTGIGFLVRSLGKRQKEKKKLVFTPRIRRLYAVSAAVWFCVLLLGIRLSGFRHPLSGIGTAAVFALFPLLLPLWVALGGLLSWPVEKIISELYFRDAQRILKTHQDLIRIGITGSWGKTSVKFILGTMLEEKYPTLVTPASFNTPMGVTRVIRTQLEPGHRVFVAEMGARHVGDIREMCRLVHPQMGLLTSVGPQHLDTFHTQERITKTKYELIEAIPEDGACFFADDDGIVTGLWEKTGKEKYLSGLHPERDDVWAENIRTSPEGSSFLLCTAQEKIPCVTDLLGELNIRNIVLCASVCLKLGMTGREIARGIRRLRPVEHRLELKRNPGGITVLDDAFNSNIRGAEQAFRTLKEFPSKRIVVTPGMVELGSQEAEMNQQFGKLMADCCDEVILVGHRRSQSIIAGLRETGFDERRVHVAANLAQAAEMLQPMAMPGDTILFENDLPDNYSEE